MPWYASSSLLDIVFCFTAAFLLMIRRRRQAWVLSLLAGACGLWMAIPWVCYAAPGSSPLWLMRWGYGAAVCIPSLVLLFALQTSKQSVKDASFLMTVFLGIGFGVLLAFPWFIQDVRQTPEEILPVPGYAFWAFTAYFAVVFFRALALIVSVYPWQTSWERNRLKWMTVAFLLLSLGATFYFLSAGTGQFFGHPLFMIGFAWVLAYAVLWRQVYEVELFTRGVASTVVTAVLSAFPLILGRVFAPIVETLPAIARFEAVSTLLATLTFYALAVALVRYSNRPSTRYLSRVFLFAAFLNAAFFTWAVPRNEFSVPVLRLTYLLAGGTIIAWVQYRRSFFDVPEKGLFSFYKVWLWGSALLLLVAAFSPYVLQSLEYYHTTRRPFAVVPGPLHFGFHLWWALSYTTAAVWVGYRFWTLFGQSRKTAFWTLIGTLIAGALTLGSLTGYGLGLLKWPLHIFLELLSAAGILATLDLQPHSDRHPTPKMLLTLFTATLLSCLSGFLLFQGLWWQLLAGLLVAFAMPRIANQFRDSAQALVDHYLFRKKFSYLNDIQQLGEDIFRFTNLPGLLKRLAEELSDRNKLSWAGIWLYDLSEGRFLLRHAAGRQHTQLDAAALFKFSFKTNEALPQCFNLERGLLLADELRIHSENPQEEVHDLEQQGLAQLEQTDLAAAFPMYLGTKLIGFLGLGHKEDQSAFHQADRQTLNLLGRAAERAVGQAYMLYEQSLMFSKLAHDTLSSLQAMGMNMDILQNEYLGPLNARQKKQLLIAAHQKELVRESLVDLRELERLMVLRMQGTWEMTPFSLKEVLDDAVLGILPRFSAQNITLSQETGPLLEAIGDSRAVRRVVDNLLVNALKATPAGGEVKLHLHQQGENLLFEVKDSSVGISENELSRLFDPFYQTADKSGIPQGTGLGLSVVKEIVALHKGKIHVHSVIGDGTLLSVELPSVLRRKELEVTPRAPLEAPRIPSP